MKECNTKENSANRRKFIGDLAKAGIVGLLPVGSGVLTVYGRSVTGQRNTQSLFRTKPYLQYLQANEVTVMWITTKPCKNWVECTDAQGRITIHVSEHQGLVDAYGYLNRITVKSLMDGASYSYTAVSQEIVDFKPYAIQWGATERSENYTFSTVKENADTVACIVFNDIHDRPASFGTLYETVGKFPFDFAVLNGDMFDYETDEDQMVSHLLEPLSSLFSANKPFYFQRGNHETRGKFARHHFEYVFEQTGYFSFVQGPVHFTFLDTGEDKEDGHREYGGLVAFDPYRVRQAEWFGKVIKEHAFRKSPFRVVFMHIPPFHSGDWHGTMHCRQLFDPLFNEGKVDLVVCGHTHVYGIHPADGNHRYPIVIGGGPLQGKRTIITMNADRQQLLLNMFGDDGSKVGELKIKAK
ncbi:MULTISPECIES: metallophosphoesterase family protein [Chitinophagaceae]